MSQLINSLDEAVHIFKLIKKSLGLAGIDVRILKEEEIPYGKKLTVSYNGQEAVANIYYGKKGAKYVYQGKNNDALYVLNRHFPVS